MPSVGYATLQVIPSVRGIGNEIRSQLGAPMQAAGQDAGAGAGEGFLSGLGGKLKAGVAAVGLAAGAILTKGIADSLEQGQITGKLKATLGATGADAGKYGKVAGELYSSAVSDTFEDAAAAIKGVVSQGLLPPDATNKQLKSIATSASDVATIMDEDLGRTTAAVSTIMRTGLAPNAEAAMDLLTRGVQTGANKAEDLLDTFTEYPVVFSKLGLDGQTAMGLLSQGLKAGARDSDYLADALKEFGIRAIDGSKTSAAGFEALGLSAKDMTAQIAAGGTGASSGLQTVLDKLKAMKDPVAQNAAAVALFGTKAEDLGNSLFALDPSSAVAALGQVGGAADGLAASLRDNAGTKIEAFKRSVSQAATEFAGGTLIPAMVTAGKAVRDTLVPAADDAGRVFRDTLLPGARELGAYLTEHLGPGASQVGDILAKYLVPPAIWLKDAAVAAAPVLREVGQVLGVTLFAGAVAVGRFLIESFLPTLASMVVWLDRNKQNIAIVAGVIGVILLPMLVALGVQMVLAGASAVASGFAMVGAWIATGAAAAFNSFLVGVAWLLIGAEAVKNAALSVVASWQVVAGWIASAAQATLSAAIVVAGWVLMGAQALWNAARMAAAWFIALGPIGWVIAAIIAVAAVIFANWDAIVSATTKAWNWVRDLVLGAVRGLVSGVTGLWGDLKAKTAEAFDWVSEKIDKVLGAVKQSFQVGRDAIAAIWDGIKEVAASPVRFVVNTVYNDGIRKVWNFIASKVGLGELDAIQGFAAGGIMPGYTPGRDNQLIAVGGGEGILRPELTRQLGAGWVNSGNAAARSGGVAGAQRFLEQQGMFGGAFSWGGVVGKIKSGIKSIPGVGDIVSTIGDVIRGGLAKAAEVGLKPVRGLINQMPESPPIAGAVRQMPLKGLDSFVKFLKGEDDKYGAEMTRLAGNVGGGVARWGGLVQQVLGELGQPLDLTPWVLKIIEFESGGNPGAINLTDINAQNGVPSQGLMQTIPPTFNAYAGPYRGAGITDPHANIYAGLNYGVNRYGAILNIPGVKSLMRGGPYLPYDSGGWLVPGATAAINKTGRPEAVLTDSQWSTMQALAANRANGGGLDGPITLIVQDGPTLTAYVDRRVDAGHDRAARALDLGPKG